METHFSSLNLLEQILKMHLIYWWWLVGTADCDRPVFSAGAWVSGCWRTAISSPVGELYSSPKYLLNHRPLHTQPTFQRMLTNDGWPRQFVMSWKHAFLPFQSSNLSAPELISPREYILQARLKEEKFFPLEVSDTLPLTVVSTNYLGRIIH